MSRKVALITGPLEPGNERYAVARIAGIELCRAYRAQSGDRLISAMPTNLHGPGDDFDLEKRHVLPALLRKAHELKERRGGVLELWKTGRPMREFLPVDDMADACVFLLRHYDGAEHVDIGGGEALSIRELAEPVLRVVGGRRRAPLRPRQARRHPPRADGREPAARHGVATAPRVGGGRRADLSLVPREPGAGALAGLGHRVMPMAGLPFEPRRAAVLGPRVGFGVREPTRSPPPRG